jgi:hypothetical protein
VAILGEIIPDPFAIPVSDTSCPSITIFLPDAFGKVSVVVIAFEQFFQFELLSLSDCVIDLLVGLRGICSPMTPVEHIKISFSLHLSTFFTFEDIDLLIFLPLAPV